MRKALYLVMFLPGISHGTTDSLQWMASSLQGLGPHGPRILLRDYALALEDDATTVWSDAERMIALLNMIDFCTSPPIMPDNPPVYDYGRFARLSKKELLLIEDLCKQYTTQEIEIRIAEMLRARDQVLGWLDALADKGSAVVGRVLWTGN